MKPLTKERVIEELIEWLNSECPSIAPPLESYTTTDLSHDFAEKLRERLDRISDLCPEPANTQTTKNGKTYHKVPLELSVETWDKLTPIERMKFKGMIVEPAKSDKSAEEILSSGRRAVRKSRFNLK